MKRIRDQKFSEKMKEEALLASEREREKEQQSQYIEVEHRKRRRDDLTSAEKITSNFPKLCIKDRLNDGLFKFDL